MISDTQAPSLSDQILSAPEPMWKKLRPALGVATREEAAQLVMRDEKAAAVAISILSPVAEEGSMLTGAPGRAIPTVLTSSAAIPSAPAKRKKGVRF